MKSPAILVAFGVGYIGLWLAMVLLGQAGIPELLPQPKPVEIAIEGWYSVAGKQDTDGLTYTGVLLLAKGKNDTYRVHWMLDVEGQLVGRGEGFGVREGNTLTVSAGNVISKYAIELQDGKPVLNGRYKVASGDGGTESWIWLKPIK